MKNPNAVVQCAMDFVSLQVAYHFAHVVVQACPKGGTIGIPGLEYLIRLVL